MEKDRGGLKFNRVSRIFGVMEKIGLSEMGSSPGDVSENPVT